MDICIITKMFPPDVGGAETYAYELSNALSRRGHNVDVYTTIPASNSENVETEENVSVEYLIPRRRLAIIDTIYLNIMARLNIDFDNYDVVHGTLEPATNLFLRPNTSMSGVPVIVTSHGTALAEVRASKPQNVIDYLLKYIIHPINITLDGIGACLADQIIAISEHTKTQLQKMYQLSAEDVSLVPHGVDINRFTPNNETHSAVTPDSLSLLFVGRLGARKGVDLAIKSLSLIDKHDIELLIAGTGRHEDRLKNLSHKYGVADRVSFLGHVPSEELPSLYSSSDIFLLPSSYEGFGLVLLESMACGTPVIGADVGGVPTAIKDEEVGYLVSRNPSSIADKIQALMNEDLRMQMSEAARSWAESLSWDEVAQDVESIYEEALTR